MALLSGPGPNPGVCDDGGCITQDPPTPDALLTISHVAMTCAVTLGIALIVLALVRRRTGVPLCRQRDMLAMATTYGLALVLAQRAFATYAAFGRYGIPANSAYSAWQDRVGEGIMAQVGQVTGTFGLFCSVTILVTALLVCVALWQVGCAVLPRR